MYMHVYPYACMYIYIAKAQARDDYNAHTTESIFLDGFYDNPIT